MARVPDPTEPLVKNGGQPSETFHAILREQKREYDALVAELKSQGGLPSEWTP